MITRLEAVCAQTEGASSHYQPTSTGPRFTFRNEQERDRARIMAARLPVRQAKLLKHSIEPDIAADARRPRPKDSP